MGIANAQIIVLKDTLIKERREHIYKPGFSIEYSDLQVHPEFIPRCQDQDGDYIDSDYLKLNSIEKLNAIVQQIFTSEERDTLATNNFYVNEIVSCSGEIVSATIGFYEHDPKVDLNKLISFSAQIKEMLKYDFVYKGNVAQPGFYSLLVKVFPTRKRK
jgi:hypothetical protein